MSSLPDDSPLNRSHSQSQLPPTGTWLRPGLLAQSTSQNGGTLPAPLSTSPSTTKISRLSRPLSSHTLSLTGLDEQEVVDAQKSWPNRRQGQVLTRGMLLKTDHFREAMRKHLDVQLHGAPNYRRGLLHVHGLAQPTKTGLAALLSLLSSTEITWISTREEPLIYINDRPFVLRDGAAPRRNLRAFAGIEADRLEQMEQRLKEDVLREAIRFKGLVLVHEERDDGAVMPVWVAVLSVMTPRDMFESHVHSSEFTRLSRMKYHRLPMSPNQVPTDGHLDNFVAVVQSLPTDRTLVLNCGMGVGRTTYGMVVSLLVRRSQLVAKGEPDPFPDNHTKDYQQSLLRLIHVLEQAVQGTHTTAVQFCFERTTHLPHLLASLQGNYRVVTDLMSCLEQGLKCKRLVDTVIDQCDAVTHLREDILRHRVAYALSQDPVRLETAHACLERYVSLVVLAAYLDEMQHQPSTEPCPTLSSWMRARKEVYGMLQTLRRKGARLSAFRPLEDLDVNVSMPSSAVDSSASEWRRTSQFAVSLLKPAVEVMNHSSLVCEEEECAAVLRQRAGHVLASHHILKIDHWNSNNNNNTNNNEMTTSMEGASNFRRALQLPVYGVAQPTLEGLNHVLDAVMHDTIFHLATSPSLSSNTAMTTPSLQKLVWLNLREEPLIYVRGDPFVLRDQFFTLRNIKSYSGIAADRLERLEQRLRDDVISEAHQYQNRILLHGESLDARVIPVWQPIASHEIETMRDLFTATMSQAVERETDTKWHCEFHRLPITAEEAPEAADFDAVMLILGRCQVQQTRVVLNCQMGNGRSTIGMIVVSQVMHWLMGHTSRHYSPTSNDIAPVSPTLTSTSPATAAYSIMYTLMRVTRDGLEVKRMVDDLVRDCCRDHVLAETIDSWRQAADQASDEHLARRALFKALQHLKRYALIFCFQAYLDQLPLRECSSQIETFVSWLQRHQEIESLLQELDHVDSQAARDALIPVDVRALDQEHQTALSTEVRDVVLRRRGAVLAPFTILKFDHFPGCQKLSLTERIDGAPNYRRVPMFSVPNSNSNPNITSNNNSNSSNINANNDRSFLYGLAMPTKQGLRATLLALDAGPQGKRRVKWTSMREEPVLYVKGKPYVLRTFQDPLVNLETTGIVRERVERMEARMKADVLAELTLYQNRVLLHEEHLTASTSAIVPVWESCEAYQVETPCEIFEAVRSEGYQVDYFRLPVTDEQAPIPGVFDLLVERMKDLAPPVDALFNCQMGRGRTTTGMVIAWLLSAVRASRGQLGWLNATVKSRNNSRTASQSTVHESVVTASTAATVNGQVAPWMATFTGDDALGNEDDDQDEEEEDWNEVVDIKRFERGEYTLILRLVAVLSHGALAKQWADRAVDACQHVQNLRRAILDFRFRLQAISPTGKENKAMLDVRQRGLNYLVRYFYLITFTNYLVEEATLWRTRYDQQQQRSSTSGTATPPFVMDEVGIAESQESLQRCQQEDQLLTQHLLDNPFSTWLAQRKEIAHLLEKKEALGFD